MADNKKQAAKAPAPLKTQLAERLPASLKTQVGKPQPEAQKPEEKLSFMEKAKRFFRETKAEYKKIVWPTQKQVVNNTGIVLAFVALAGVFVSAIDAGLGLILRLLLRGAV